MRKRAFPRRAGAVAALALVAVATGCGGGNPGTPAQSGGGPPGEGGSLVWAVADRVARPDPLQAKTRADQLVARQVNEPLTAKPVGPFDPDRRVPGLAKRVRGSGDQTIWTLSLRTGIRFQDGTPFNAAAVQANATRWLTTAAGRAALPGLVTVDSPRPDEVRFVLSSPDPSFPKHLASPRLGIVSPQALEPSSGDGAVLGRSAQTGTGAFEIRERDATGILLARNTAWWAATADVDLGPALDQIELRTEPSASLRFAMLDAGEAQLADELQSAQARQARSDPLLSVLRGGGDTWLGIERSVRGVDSARQIPALSSAWLTNVNVAG